MGGTVEVTDGAVILKVKVAGFCRVEKYFGDEELPQNVEKTGELVEDDEPLTSGFFEAINVGEFTETALLRRVRAARAAYRRSQWSRD